MGFVVLPLYKPCCWQKWFSTMSELILEGTTYPRGNLFKCITHISLKVRSIFSISSKHFGEISFLTVLTPVVFNCAISFFQPWNQSNASFSILIRQSDKDVTGRESRNTEIIREVCLSNCIEELDENRRWGLTERPPSNIRSPHLTYLLQDDFSSSPNCSDTSADLICYFVT